MLLINKKTETQKFKKKKSPISNSKLWSQVSKSGLKSVKIYVLNHYGLWPPI